MSSETQVRTDLMKWLHRELIGPSEPDELLDNPPSLNYLCGSLAPQNSTVDQSEDDELPRAGDDDEDTYELQIPLQGALRQSSMGLSFAVRPGITTIRAVVKYAMYAREQKDGHHVWRRYGFREEHPIDLLTPPANGLRMNNNPDLSLEWVTRPARDRLAVSLFLVNRKEEPPEPPKDHAWVFQPEIDLIGEHAGSRPFVTRNNEDLANTPDEDRRLNALLYRHILTFAVGHGTAVEWTEVGPDKTAGALHSQWMPSHEVPLTMPRLSGSKADLHMSALAGAKTGKEVLACLAPLLEEYGQWIDDRQNEIPGLPAHLQTVAGENLEECRFALNRMKQGLDLIATRRDVLRAFTFANHAMMLQQAHSRWAAAFRKAGSRKTPEPVLDGEWRPFQIAFVLQAIAGVVDPTDDGRSIADLLWFPTGGGKTEAYLGLTAFTLAWRRVSNGTHGKYRGDAGVAVLMRYTLRLLTIQQFQRATALICACEVLRRKAPAKWGHEPFRIGLWVGKGSTPNTFEQSKEGLQARLARKRPRDGDPVQLVSCPWCGTSLTPLHYQCDTETQRTLVYCPDKDCEFSKKRSPEGLPVVVVDDEVYRLLPSMIIGTVDKFAQLPWKGDTQALFGRVSRHCPRHGYLAEYDGENHRHYSTTNRPAEGATDTQPLLPPDLIIQDELHLISGPLGTLVGLYETAVDWLCSREEDGKIIRPKVVASTATVRRARPQVNALFNRSLAVFPPPGLSADDSFFARKVDPEKKPGRLYVGVYAPGKSIKTAEVRVYAALLASAAKEFESYPKQADPYMTLVGYFNSLRELGGTVRLVEDDIRSRLDVLSQRGFPKRWVNELKELTSRIDSGDIPKILDQLDKAFHEPREKGKYPIDTLLASNMISVGVDVNRLGLMVVTGQPKTTAEYIQATSRVGRQHPGLVVMLYNWIRPRDRSHYEQFGTYHSALYQYVEALSVTPFSSRARDRGLNGVLTAMTRLAVPGLADSRAAGQFRADDPAVQKIIGAICSRVHDLGGPENAVREELLALVDAWARETKKGTLRYEWRSPYQKCPDPLLLKNAGTTEPGLWPTLGSLRDVEAQAGIRKE
jgi:hypothetical protein